MTTENGDDQDQVNPPIGEEWQTCIYETAWSQYAHEDELRHNKNTLYISIETALIAFLPGTVALLKDVPNIELGGFQFRLSVLLIGLVGLLISWFGLRVAFFWAAVIRSGRAWLYLRLASIHQLEHVAGIGRLGMSHLEAEWEAKCKANPSEHGDLDEKSFYPFKEISELSEFSIHPQGEIGESKSVLGLIQFLEKLWIAMILVSIVVALIAFVPVNTSGDPKSLNQGSPTEVVVEVVPTIDEPQNGIGDTPKSIGGIASPSAREVMEKLDSTRPDVIPQQPKTEKQGAQ